MVEHVRLARADVRVVDRLMDAHRRDLDPLAVFPVAAGLRDLADVDLGVEVGREGLAVAAGVAVDDVEVVQLGEVVLGFTNLITAKKFLS